MINFKTIRNIPRVGEITTTLVRHGLSHIADQLGLPIYERLRTLVRGSEPLPDMHQGLPERIRYCLEELGPTFIKFGQILSTRPDLVGEEFVREFSKLQDDVPPMAPARVAVVIEGELGAPPEEVFASFDPRPFAAASIGQVHVARLDDGSDVVVKVQREGITETISSDLDILYFLARTIEENDIIPETFDPVEIVAEFSRSIRKELDYVREAQNIETFRENFSENPFVKIPMVHPAYSTRRVLTMERIQGTKAKNADLSCIDGPLVARRGAQAILQQIFRDGCFHADPHPGNLIILPGGVVSFIDFGMVGRLSVKMKDHISGLLINLFTKDYEALARELVLIGEPAHEIDMDRLAMALLNELDTYHGLPLEKLDLGSLLSDLLALLGRFHLKLPGNYTLMLKALISLETLGRGLDPQFDLVHEASPYVRDLVMERWRPERLARDLKLTFMDVGGFLKRTPEQLTKIMHKMQHGNLSIEFRHRGLEDYIHTLDKVSNRLSFALVISALLVGSSFIMGTAIEPRLMGYPWLGVIGFGVAGFLGFWLAIGILRSGRL